MGTAGEDMAIEDKLLEPFKEICRRICLNIPGGCCWQWDHQRDMARITLEKQDSELVYFPLLREFNDRWSFALSPPEALIARLLDAEYGLLPGQTFFASQPIGSLVLVAAWWPWGDEDKVSMRVGLLQLDRSRIIPGLSFSHLSRWLPLNGNQAA
jgi:hypothetical protein